MNRNSSAQPARRAETREKRLRPRRRSCSEKQKEDEPSCAACSWPEYLGQSDSCQAWTSAKTKAPAHCNSSMRPSDSNDKTLEWQLDNPGPTHFRIIWPSPTTRRTDSPTRPSTTKSKARAEPDLPCNRKPGLCPQFAATGLSYPATPLARAAMLQ